SFFFSSRRRHTRSKRDWSSDVCSSDLPIDLHVLQTVMKMFLLRKKDQSFFLSFLVGPCPTLILRVSRLERDSFEKKYRTINDNRSEERRVGKEYRERKGRDIEEKRVGQ